MFASQYEEFTVTICGDFTIAGRMFGKTGEKLLACGLRFFGCSVC